MNYRSLALAIAALSSAHITTAAAQSVYVAPGGVYIGGGPVYVIPAPSNGNGTYVEPTPTDTECRNPRHTWRRRWWHLAPAMWRLRPTA